MGRNGLRPGATEGFVEYIRAKREVRHALVISDPKPVENVKKVWASAGQAATIGIFLLLFGAFLYIGRAILLPVLAAAVVALTLAPLIKAAKRVGISPWLTALVILAFGLGALSLLATALAGPVSEWIGRAPEIGATIQQKLSVLDQPLAALHELEGRCSAATIPRRGRQRRPACRAARGRLSHARRGRAVAVLRHAVISFSSARSNCAIRPSRCSPIATPSCGF